MTVFCSKEIKGPPKTHIALIKDFLIFARDNDLKFKIDDAYGKRYILDDKEINDDELIDLYYAE